MNDFFPEDDYTIPEASNYMKLTDGENKFRVLSRAITGYEYWNKEDKPVRAKEKWDTTPEDIKRDKDGKASINHFWAFIVWNYNTKSVQLLQIRQKGIMRYMQGLIKNPAWGSPMGYDLVINRSGSGFDTEYTTVANPHSPVDPEILEKYGKMNIDLEKMFTGEDPFAG